MNNYTDLTLPADKSELLRRRASLRKKFNPKKADLEEVDTVVIGSGMGGLSCAAILARLGRKVVVLEQHQDVAGGGTHQYDLGGYRFDSGIHYTVPWSVPLFAMTCFKPLWAVPSFDIMGDASDTLDKIYLFPYKHPEAKAAAFNMKNREAHLKQLYADYPEEKEALDKYMVISNRAMVYVKFYLFARLLPQWLQSLYWKLVPSCYIETASLTAEEILPRLTSNKRLIALLSSMWIDTGARPDKATFMLTASVFRGLAMECGCYPRDGSEVMATELVRTIEENGGQVFIRAKVDKILVDQGRVSGVRMVDGTLIQSKRVVSSAGYYATYRRLIDDSIREKYQIPLDLVPQSAGFVMVNVGMSAEPEKVGITCSNTWHIPIEEDGDAFVPLKSYFNQPLPLPSSSSSDEDFQSALLKVPAFITFPSMKDKAWGESHPGKISSQILMMADYSWFAKFSKFASSPASRDSEEYKNLKEQWKTAALTIFKKYFPAAAEHIDFVDISTPLSIEDWLHEYEGGAVGIDVTPERFVDDRIRANLDCVTPIPGLFLTGQDTSICGVTLAQIAGVTTALRMEGFVALCKILFSSILQGFLAKKPATKTC